jgi:hypothetical protein
LNEKWRETLFDIFWEEWFSDGLGELCIWAWAMDSTRSVQEHKVPSWYIFWLHL